LKRRSNEEWQLKKERRRPRKRQLPRKQPRRKQPRRDSSVQDVSTATLNWRTQISEASMAFQKERRELQVKLVVPFVFGNCFA
jgi:hypothetical protein